MPFPPVGYLKEATPRAICIPLKMIRLYCIFAGDFVILLV